MAEDSKQLMDAINEAGRQLTDVINQTENNLLKKFKDPLSRILSLITAGSTVIVAAFSYCVNHKAEEIRRNAEIIKNNAEIIKTNVDIHQSEATLGTTLYREVFNVLPDGNK